MGHKTQKIVETFEAPERALDGVYLVKIMPTLHTMMGKLSDQNMQAGWLGYGVDAVRLASLQGKFTQTDWRDVDDVGDPLLGKGGPIMWTDSWPRRKLCLFYPYC